MTMPIKQENWKKIICYDEEFGMNDSWNLRLNYG